MSTARPPTEVLAYYFPQYHRDPRNDVLHGAGWTEWDLLRAARPRFPGHHQPIVSAWGEFDESDPAWAAQEIELAADHGITGFLYDWYWYERQPFLEGALNRGFLRAPNRSRLKFALMWANHDWLDLFPSGAEHRPQVLMSGAVDRSSFDDATRHIIGAYFTQPNYLHVAGAPYFSIYELGTLVAGLGGLDATRDALDAFRASARAAGFPGVHLNAVVWGFTVLPSEGTLRDPAQIVRSLGFSSTTSYAWVHHHRSPPGRFPHGRYADAARDNMAAWAQYAAGFGVPYFPNVSMGWDPSPRTRQDQPFGDHGYPWTSVLEGNTPGAFEEALLAARAHLDAAGTEPCVLTLNAWNEWTEGSYLLPDTRHGTAYLEAVARVFPPEVVPSPASAGR